MSHTPLMRSFLRMLQTARRHNLKASGVPLPINKQHLSASRRQFLKTTGAMGLASMAASLPFNPAQAATKRVASMAIVGAGLAGLNAAYQLQKVGVYADVYEASNRAGGRVLSRTGLVADGLVTEIGAEFINTDHDDMIALANEFGLSLFDRRADITGLTVPTSAYYFAGKNWTETELADLLRPLVAQISHDADLLDQNWSKYAPKFDRLSVAAYLDKHADKIPDPVVRALFENTIRTEYGAEAIESSALQLLFLLPSVNGTAVELLGYSDETYTVDGGNSRIIDGLTNALSGQIHYGSALSKLDKDRHDGYELSFANGGKAYADFVILAMPFGVLRQVELDIPLPNTLRQFINELDLGKNEKIQGGFAQRVWRQQGFSLEAWTDLGFSEAWDGTARQPDHTDGVLTYFLGGNEVMNANNITGGSQAVGQQFTKGMSAYLTELESQATGKYIGTRWTTNPYSHGAYANFKPGQLTQFGNYFWVESDVPGESQSVNVGRVVIAGEQVSDAYYGFMNGGAQTGRLAANLVLQQMGMMASTNTETRSV